MELIGLKTFRLLRDGLQTFVTAKFEISTEKRKHSILKYFSSDTRQGINAEWCSEVMWKLISIHIRLEINAMGMTLLISSLFLTNLQQLVM